MIRGKKNFIHPSRMEMGLTFLYKLDTESFQKKVQAEREKAKERKEESESVLKREESMPS